MNDAISSTLSTDMKAIPSSNSPSPYIDNPVARQRMRDLADEYVLGFLFNPGGGGFTHRLYGPTCQITTCDDDEDLLRLGTWLKVHGVEIKEVFFLANILSRQSMIIGKMLANPHIPSE